MARMMENSLPQNSSSDGIHFDKPRGAEWLNGVFQRQINLLDSDLVEAGQSPWVLPRGLLFPARPVADRLGGRIGSRESSRSSRSRFDNHEEGRGGVFHTPELGGILGSGGGHQEEGRRPWRNEQSRVSATNERSGP